MSLIGLIWLIVKLLVLGLVYYGVRWVAGFLGVSAPEIVWKIFGLILALIGVVMILAYIGVG